MEIEMNEKLGSATRFVLLYGFSYLIDALMPMSLMVYSTMKIWFMSSYKQTRIVFRRCLDAKV